MHPTMPPDGSEVATTETKSRGRARWSRLRERARSLLSSKKFEDFALGTLAMAVLAGLTFTPPRTILPFLVIALWVGWQTHHRTRDRQDLERLQREVARLGRNINPCRSLLNQPPPMLKRMVVASDGKILRIDPPAEPTCGVDFCRKCGACLVCYGARPCDGPEDTTFWGDWESTDLRDIAAGAEDDVRHSWVYVPDEPARDEFAEGIERRYGERLRRGYPNAARG